jgi:uncharacterized protein (DUF885 family)
MPAMLALSLALALAAAPAAAPARPTDPLQDLSARFWAWRSSTQPTPSDDVNRIERPEGWKASWSRASVDELRRHLAAFEAEWRTIPAGGADRAREVDRRLVGSALARVRWELDLWPRWRRDPTFYLEQSMGPLVEVLVAPPPLDDRRAAAVLRHLENVPAVLADGRANLDQGVAAFARLAEGPLEGVRERLRRCSIALAPELPPGADAARLAAAVEKAADALEGYRTWLAKAGPGWKAPAAPGEARYRWFLRNVAFVADAPAALLAAAGQEWERAVAAEAVERERNRDLAELPTYASVEEQAAATEAGDREIRAFLEAKGLLTVPLSTGHFTVRPLPAYLEALADFGALIDFTGPSRIGEDAVRWIPPPSPRLGYFSRVNARDPRPLLVHEGVPGHHLQLVLSWAHPDPIRRRYHDSVANEGLGFYAEELMLQAGLFDDRPRVRELLWSLARLRAARVEVDVSLATGAVTVEQAAARLAERAPMDLATAREEVAFFATGPGQALTYQVGKLQLVRLLAEARARKGETFDLRAFHDWLWMNGNVPPALLRHELLGATDELARIDAAVAVVRP